ncbi:hypothetical protein V6Z12_A04G026700 [Gossypium hirsutum]
MEITAQINLKGSRSTWRPNQLDFVGIEMDSATVHEEIDSLFESTPPLKDSAKIIDKLNQVIQFDSPSEKEKGGE